MPAILSQNFRCVAHIVVCSYACPHLPILAVFDAIKSAETFVDFALHDHCHILDPLPFTQTCEPVRGNTIPLHFSLMLVQELSGLVDICIPAEGGADGRVIPEQLFHFSVISTSDNIIAMKNVHKTA